MTLGSILEDTPIQADETRTVVPGDFSPRAERSSRRPHGRAARPRVADRRGLDPRRARHRRRHRLHPRSQREGQLPLLRSPRLRLLRQRRLARSPRRHPHVQPDASRPPHPDAHSRDARHERPRTETAGRQGTNRRSLVHRRCRVAGNPRAGRRALHHPQRVQLRPAAASRDLPQAQSQSGRQALPRCDARHHRRDRRLR